MGKTDQKRCVYTKEFKAEAAALAKKHEKPVIQVARSLGGKDSVLHKWLKQPREAGGEMGLVVPEARHHISAELRRLGVSDGDVGPV